MVCDHFVQGAEQGYVETPWLHWHCASGEWIYVFKEETSMNAPVEQKQLFFLVLVWSFVALYVLNFTEHGMKVLVKPINVFCGCAMGVAKKKLNVYFTSR